MSLHMVTRETTAQLTWDQLAELDPRLQDLLARAKLKKNLCEYCRWYGRWTGGVRIPGLKSEVVDLVGFNSRHPDPALRTSGAYDSRRNSLHQTMPNLRGGRGMSATRLFAVGQEKPAEHGFDKLLHDVPGEALGMLIMHHRDEALRLTRAKRSSGLVILTPVGNDAQIIWHEALIGELRREAERRDTDSSV